MTRDEKLREAAKESTQRHTVPVAPGERRAFHAGYLLGANWQRDQSVELVELAENTLKGFVDLERTDNPLHGTEEYFVEYCRCLDAAKIALAALSNAKGKV